MISLDRDQAPVADELVTLTKRRDRVLTYAEAAAAIEAVERVRNLAAVAAYGRLGKRASRPAPPDDATAQARRLVRDLRAAAARRRS